MITPGLRPVLFEFSKFWSDTSFHNSFVKKSASFLGANFGYNATFSAANFSTEVPVFFQCVFPQNTQFELNSSYWPPVGSSNVAFSKTAYARLRQVMSELQRPEEEHFFLRQELRCRALEYSAPERWIFQVYEALSDFGYSITRPVGALFLVWLLWSGGFDIGRRWAWVAWPEGFDGIALPFALSFANLFAFLGFHRLYLTDFLAQAPGWVAVLGGIQTILGVILLFLLGLGLRNRFRLK